MKYMGEIGGDEQLCPLTVHLLIVKFIKASQNRKTWDIIYKHCMY